MSSLKMLKTQVDNLELLVTKLVEKSTVAVKLDTVMYTRLTILQADLKVLLLENVKVTARVKKLEEIDAVLQADFETLLSWNLTLTARIKKLEEK